MSNKNRVQMIAVVSRATRKNELEIVAFCDGTKKIGIRNITRVLLSETACLYRKIKMHENIMLSAWFNQCDPSIPVGQQALVALLTMESPTLKEEFEVTPLGHASMRTEADMPIHLPTASVSTKKKLYASHWDQLRGLVNQWQQYQATGGEVAPGSAQKTAEEAIKEAEEKYYPKDDCGPEGCPLPGGFGAPKESSAEDSPGRVLDLSEGGEFDTE